MLFRIHRFILTPKKSLEKKKANSVFVSEFVFFICGGAKGTRTPGLCVANASLYQLSYNPTGLVTIKLTRPRTIKPCGLKPSLVAVRKIFHRTRRVKFWWRWGEHSRLRLPWSLTRPRTIKPCGLKSSLVAVRKIFHRARRVKFWWRWGESNSLPTRIGETFYKFSQSFEVADSVGTANKAHRRHVAESVNAPRQERKEVRRLR